MSNDTNTLIEGSVYIADNSDPTEFGYGTLEAQTSLTSKTVNLRRAPFIVTLDTDSGLSTGYTFKYPAAPPTSDCSVIASSGGTNVFYEVHAEHTVNVRLNPGPGEFGSVSAALASIPTIGPDAPADNNRWTVYIYNGDYLEPNFTIPDYVFLVGESMQSCRLAQATPGAEFITMGTETGLAFLTVRDCDPAFPAICFCNVGDYALIHKIEIENCEQGIYCLNDVSSTSYSLVYLEYVGTSDCKQYTLKIICQNPNPANYMQVSIENFFSWGECAQAIYIEGENASVISQATVLQGNGTGDEIGRAHV